MSQKYPLSDRWEFPELFSEILSLNSVQIQMVGLSTKHRQTGQMVTGSAAQTNGSPMLRCYFELLERTSILEAEERLSPPYRLVDKEGGVSEKGSREDVFPESAEPTAWRYAKSNGVAAHTQWHHAASSAELELLERDRILRSWYGAIEPTRVKFSLDLIPQKLGEYYDFECYLFPEKEVEEQAQVAGVFGFPKSPIVPRVYGFAARPSEMGALIGATQECLQTLAFLWGESFDGELPPFSPTPDYHQEFFLRPKGVDRLRRWLNGEFLKYRCAPVSALGERKTFFLDITPEHLNSKIYVVKAICPLRTPLTFGRHIPFPIEGLPEELLLHPIV